MALTPTQEAQVLQLVAQQAALLSLAGNEATITSKLGATKVNLSQLPAASVVNDADIFLIRQGTTDKSVPSSIIKTYAGSGTASETVAGISRLATDSETQAGISRALAVDPAALHSALCGTVGDMRNAKMMVATASATATFTADQIIVASSLGGAEYRVSSFSQAINLATVGAGGMDVGTAPLSGYLAMYALYNPTTAAKGIVLVNASSAAQPNIYGGANMPAGFTASALIGVWPTTPAGLLVAGTQADRRFDSTRTMVLTGASAGAFTLLSIAGAVPLNARGVHGHAQASSTVASTVEIDLAASASGICYSVISGSTVLTALGQFSLPIITPQVLYYAASATSGTSNGFIAVTGYIF